MNEGTLSRFPVPHMEDIPDDLRADMLALQDKIGFVPNVFLTLAHRPDELRAFMAYHDALMLRESGLTKGEKEMIVVATSGLNQCLYCVVAHGAILRIYEKAPRLADQLATNYRKADITARQRAMLDFAVKVSRQAEQMEQGDFDTLTEHGFEQEDAWDIGAISACFAMSNRLANLTDMRPNPEFHIIGRMEKQ